ncbi:pirin family protein [Thalassotalea euphylliae]|uniref:pirin family protein n=1 Tax=Thalassotalea euphylliae TaxID=1655234 RepID=UPI0036343E37
MEILKFDELPQGGFAGLIEKQFVKDQKVFSPARQGKATNGIGNFVYLADANFLPHGETGMHPHREIDVISVMVEGKVNHQGSLEHGKSLVAGEIQAQRAGAEGFSHNEINPSNQRNQLIQLWVLPDKTGMPASYKTYLPETNQLTKVYGGDANQTKTLTSQTEIYVANTEGNFSTTFDSAAIIYISKGNVIVNDRELPARTLVKVKDGFTLSSHESSQIIVIRGQSNQ